MTTTAQLLITLNSLRARAGKPPMKDWKESRVKLEAAIDKLDAELPKPVAKKSTKSSDKPGRKGEFAEWCRANGFNPKVARAKLRKANHPRNGSRYELNADAIAIVKGK